jgi:choline dehydrogenase-like flavoprotein
VFNASGAWLITVVKAKSARRSPVFPRAIQTGKCELRANCFVTRILTDAKGRPDRVEYFDGRHQGHEQYADLIVVSCSATESARLLLNSASKFHPKGLGNSSGQVGRNLNDHTGADTFGIFDREIPHDKGPGPSIAFNDWNHPRSREIPGGGYIYNYYCTLAIEFAGTRSPGEPLWGSAHKELQHRLFRRYISAAIDRDLPKTRTAWISTRRFEMRGVCR